jgi:mevalonate kinase
LDKKKIFEMAYAAVLDVQGKGSGFDVAAAVYGGTVYYQNGGEIVRPLEFGELPIVIGFSGEKVSTTNYIEHVRQLRDKHPALVNKIFELMGDIVIRAETEFEAQNWENIGDLANINQGLVDGLGVSTAKLNNLIFAARDNGALGAKLSGAGGGDCMFGVVSPDNIGSVRNGIEEAGGSVVGLPVHADGVRIEA